MGSARYISDKDMYALHRLEHYFLSNEQLSNNDRLIISAFFERVSSWNVEFTVPLKKEKSQQLSNKRRTIKQTREPNRKKCRAAGCTNDEERYGLCMAHCVEFNLIPAEKVGASSNENVSTKSN